ISHDGAWQGFTTAICRYVNDKLTTIALTNLDSEHSDPDIIARTVAGFYVPAVAPPPPPKAIADNEPQVTALLTNVIAQQEAGKLDLSVFAPKQQQALTTERQQRMRDFLLDKGPLQTVELLSRKEENGVRTYTYRGHFAYRTLTLLMRLDGNGKIAGFGFSL
ncbi:MAG TPA: hypothetical protein VKB26_06690, partial [Candidatus Acidoferrales bacterium]|nr:hypothetical protein [Candidatus Acidoferrales bacterium]